MPPCILRPEAAALRLPPRAPGAAADQARDDGATALYRACSDGRLELAEALLAAGAAVEQASPSVRQSVSQSLPHS